MPRLQRRSDTRRAFRWRETLPATRWCVVLAGGDGTRLLSLTRFICDDDRPKQYCPLMGDSTLLAETRRRAERVVPPQQVLFAVTRAHREYYLPELRTVAHQRIVQPSNRGTAPPILYSLLSVAAIDPDATVAVLPCDHHYANDQLFDEALESAFETAEKRPGSVVLLGARPTYPETEYGWIELGSGCTDAADVFLVNRFWEKPHLEGAQELLNRRTVWNTFVMVGSVRAFLDLVQAAIPDVLELFRQTRVWAGSEMHIEDSFYRRIEPIDFSRQVLAAQPAKLVVQRAGEIGWSDLGDPGRVLTVLDEQGLNPRWLEEWRRSRRSVAAAAAIAPRVQPAVA